MNSYSIRITKTSGEQTIHKIISRASKWFVTQSFLFHNKNIKTFIIE
jgi:hypothetical protein